ncbi:4Fe-4S binding protein [Halonatronum saccharophilum]|uniref:4Fe-4S binding protein n=1 Tax=Halonatronum saccharophilum TaxID=150060 RepID=UPI0004817C2A|nr:4Fe-4S binding protein [Halonatronum saccharophilum]
MKKKSFITKIGKFSWIFLVAYLILGWRYLGVGILALLCILAPPIVAVYNDGRIWCGNLCPRGSFNDNLLKKISRQKIIPQAFSSIYLRVFALFFLFFIFFTGIFYSSGEFNVISALLYRIVLFTTIITIILGVVINQRTWCKFCPMGSLATFLTLCKRNIDVKVQSVQVKEEKCNKCNLCEKGCKMDLKPHSFDRAKNNDLDCLHCQKCIKICPQDALKIDS